jgi:hypothetical protein
VCASQLRWGLTTYEPVGPLNQGTVILAQHNQELLQSQRGSAAWTSQAGGFQHGGMPGGFVAQPGLPAGFVAQTGYTNVREVTSTRETRSTHSSRETSSLVRTTLCVDDIPRFNPNLADGLKFKKLTYGFFSIALLHA